MAMKQNVELPSGVVAKYHRIEAWRVARTPQGMVAEASIAMYLNEDKAKSGASPLHVAALPIRITEEGEPTREMLYRLITAPTRYIDQEFQEPAYLTEPVLYEEDVLYPEDVYLSSNEVDEHGEEKYPYPPGKLAFKKGDVQIAKGTVKHAANQNVLLTKTRSVPDPETTNPFNGATRV